MKKLMMLFVVALTSVAVHAQQKVAKIEFKETTIDYGDIAKGSNGERTFEFTNTGAAPLIITDVKSSCGCTVPSWTKDPVAPGKKGEIKVKYNTNIVGPIRKTIIVMSNADTPNVPLKIKGTVEAQSSKK
ncbi:DUF1573 domain-containing protein [Zhouia sp. PK063]|uniref:DUF1573 domain-containing protein n=1 Tax=Zhouia sp. PK063 TaxID=3373602 RepID=UPI0037AEAA74